MSIPKYQTQMLPTKYPITKIQIFRVLQLCPPQKNSVPGIPLGRQGVLDFKSSMITSLYRDKNNLLGPQLSFKFSITRISPDDTIILMPVRHWDKFRQYPFLTRYFFTLEDPHRTIHDIHFRQGTIVPSCIIFYTTKYISTNYRAINAYLYTSKFRPLTNQYFSQLKSFSKYTYNNSRRPHLSINTSPAQLNSQF